MTADFERGVLAAYEAMHAIPGPMTVPDMLQAVLALLPPASTGAGGEPVAWQFRAKTGDHWTAWTFCDAEYAEWIKEHPAGGRNELRALGVIATPTPPGCPIPGAEPRGCPTPGACSCPIPGAGVDAVAEADRLVSLLYAGGISRGKDARHGWEMGGERAYLADACMLDDVRDAIGAIARALAADAQKGGA